MNNHLKRTPHLNDCASAWGNFSVACNGILHLDIEDEHALKIMEYKREADERALFLQDNKVKKQVSEMSSLQWNHSNEEVEDEIQNLLLFGSIKNMDVIKKSIRFHLENMDEDERLDFFNEIREGYCHDCGREDPNNNCHCWNDE